MVLVLISVVLLSVLVLGFFSSAVWQKKSTTAFRNSTDVQELARLGVDAVIAQIRAATTENGTSWASQPGAIRTYGIDATYNALSATGSRSEKVYKLYSTGNMTVSGDDFNAADEVPPSDWNTQPGIYVDLNAPMISTTTNGSQNLNFPIIDPRAYTTSNSTSVQGFSYNATVAGTVLPSNVSGDDSQRLPMPARWLYVLQDGQVVNPVSQSGDVVTVPGASKTNPIVGRVAFWTDDETAKININTAGGDIWNSSNASYAGSYWSPPYAHSEFDQKKLAMAQPYQREYQRYPGHPGTVHLSAVFPNLSLSEIMSLTPRYRFGGSEGGTIDLNTTGSAITPKTDRLYASVDEMIYDPNRAETSTIDKNQLERSRFFLTANSRASDLNLFGLPKVSAWPIHRRTGPQYRTPFDETIAFCTTANGNEYFFTRNNASDPQGDFNKRNEEIYDYLGNLMERKVPGLGGNGTLVNKWTSPERWQILTQIYDYIRSTNLTDTSTPNILPYAMNSPSRNFTPEDSGLGQVLPTSIVKNGIPTAGFGRYPVVSEIGFMIIQVEPTAADLANAPAIDPNYSGRVWCQVIILVELNCPAHGFDLLGLNLNLAFSGINQFAIAGENVPASGLSKINGQPPGTYVNIGFSDATLELQQYSGRGPSYPNFGIYPRGWGGAISPLSLMFQGDNTVKDSSGGGGNSYPLISQRFCIDYKPPTNLIRIRKCDFSVTQTAGFGNSLVYNFTFPELGGVANDNRIRVPIENYFATFKERVEGDPRDFFKNTTVRTLEPKFSAAMKADLRHYLANGIAAGSLNSSFEEHAEYKAGFNTSKYILHGFQIGDGHSWGNWGDSFYFKVGQGFGKGFITSQPNISSHAPSLYLMPNFDGNPGDWDSGIGPFSDGAYINKPDDGSTLVASGSTTSSNIYYEPYFRSFGGYQSTGLTYFSPNRILPSSVMFGSLPSGIKRQRPWETLLFTPGPAAGVNHKGLEPDKVPDHVVLDLFHMPIVEPYAISEPFSTAGRVNLNNRIVPFNYISRDTSLRAAFRGIRVPVVSADSLGGYGSSTQAAWINSDPFQYKMSRGAGALFGTLTYNATNKRIYHRPIDLETTIDGFRKRMDSDNLFRSATEICDMFLVPDLRASAGSHFLNSGLSSPAPNINTGTYNATNLRDFWTATGDGLKWSGLTGDNLRERPYALLYPLVTTKSNSYTVHVIAQTLQNSTQAADDQFIERDGAVTGEWQGSYLIERQLAQNDPGLIDYTQNSNPAPANHPEHLHKIRVLQTQRFNPGK